MRFGIGMNGDHTLTEVGQQFSLTRERIRQIEGQGAKESEAPEFDQAYSGASSIIEMAEHNFRNRGRY